MQVSVIGQGLGYSLANLFASKKINTIGLDLRTEVFENPRIDRYMKNYIKRNEKNIKKYIKFTTNYKYISKSDIVFCFVDTPLESNKRLGLNSVINATRSALEVIKNECTFVMMSTLPVNGSNILFDMFGDNLKQRYIYCPPMVRQENFLQNYLKPPYILLGHEKNPEGVKKVKKFLMKFVKNKPPIWETTPLNVEICKLATNAYGIMKGVFFNKLGEFAKTTGADPKLVCQMVSSHKVVGKGYTTPAGAILGPCLPRDTKELYNFADGGLSSLLKKVEELNTPFE